MNNMYDWVAKQRPNFIGGQCPHNCVYCHTKDSPWPNVRKKYTGKIRLFEDEFKKPLKADKPIFIGSCFDMFADAVPMKWIVEILIHCNEFDNQYVFQSKNTRRFNDYNILHTFPENSILGTTIETDDGDFLKSISNVFLNPWKRAKYLSMFNDFERFVTIEPILNFNLEHFVQIIRIAEPTWVNVGADSKRHNLPEPSWMKVQDLIAELEKFTTVKQKKNLERLEK